MLYERNIGSIWLPEELIDAIETHRNQMLEANKNSASYNFLLNADFKDYLSDYLIKFSYKMRGE